MGRVTVGALHERQTEESVSSFAYDTVQALYAKRVEEWQRWEVAARSAVATTAKSG